MMTSPIQFPAMVIGLMSGTSADGVDAALITTDGRDLVRAQQALFTPYIDGLRRDILSLMRGEGDKSAVAKALTLVHIAAVRALLKKSELAAESVALIGFHGQTIRHAPKEGITEQIGDPALMATELGIPVVADFRSNDVKNGGQGAPLVPLYHAALAAGLSKPLMVVNIGGVANVTWIGTDDGSDPRSAMHEPRSEGVSEAKGGAPPSENLLAFDCGPGNALLDDWVHRHKGARYDTDGALAAQGRVDGAVLARFLIDPFFALPAPKSLDRNHFDASAALIAPLTPQDGAATLTAMTAASIGSAVRHMPAHPRQLLITGGGRHNPTLMRMIAEYSQCEVAPVESVGWDGDMLEAQAFAYLAARSVLGLPLSLPSTTGVARPVTGGVFYPAGCAAAS